MLQVADAVISSRCIDCRKLPWTMALHPTAHGIHLHHSILAGSRRYFCPPRRCFDTCAARLHCPSNLQQAAVMTLFTLCSRLCLYTAVLAAGRPVKAASINTTEEVINNIHAPGTLGTPASNFTTGTNYTAISQIISSTPDCYKAMALTSSLFTNHSASLDSPLSSVNQCKVNTAPDTASDIHLYCR